MSGNLGVNFTRIYENQEWGSGSIKNPLSGTGSNPDHAKPYVYFVKRVILDFDIESVVDIGHGDWAMWRDYKFENVNYKGYDVADEISSKVSKIYGSINKTFEKVDEHSKYPNADLMICKDVLQHLSLNDIDLVLSQLQKFKFVVFCNDIQSKIPVFRRIRFLFQFRERVKRLSKLRSPFYSGKILENNSEIVSGGYRGLDLLSSIFANQLKDFELIEKLEFTGGHPKGTSKQVLFFRNLKK